jgi:hypothetical protein
MASVSRESIFGVQTSTARKNHRSGHTKGRLTTNAKRILRTEGNRWRHTVAWSPSREHWPRAVRRNTGSVVVLLQGWRGGRSVFHRVGSMDALTWLRKQLDVELA